MSSDVIPYTVKPRPDTGLTNPKFGIWLFLASEIMLFGALFSSYVLLRVGAKNWPVGSSLLNVPLGTLNTTVLVISSIMMVFAWASLKLNQFKRFKFFLGMTILLGISFLIIKACEYHLEFSEHHFPSTNTFLALYFTLTGLHALHIVGGTIVNIYMWGPGSRMWKTDPEHFTNRIEIAGIYWHFVDLLWIFFLFPVLYLL